MARHSSRSRLVALPIAANTAPLRRSVPSVILGMRKLQATPLEDHPDNLQSLVARLVPDWAAGEIDNFQYLPGGYGNRNYRFDYRNANYVLRLSAHTQPATDRNLEQQFYAAPGSVAVAPLVAYEAGSGNMISRWQEGTLLAQTIPTPSSAVIARYVQNLHSGLPDNPRIYNPVALARRYLATGNPDRRVAELAGALNWPAAPATTCHNDLNPWNVIRPPRGEWITLDWEWLGRNDPLFDLVSLHQGLGLNDGDLLPLATQYLQASADPARLELCLTAFWLREYAWAHAELVRGNKRVEIVEQRRAALLRLRCL